MKWKDLRDQACPIARSLSVIGDRWTMLILRDLFAGITRFDALQRNLGITRHVLTDRLQMLEEAGVLERKPYQSRPPRHDYLLTDRGDALYPVIVLLADWADNHAPANEDTPYALRSKQDGRRLSPVLKDKKSGEEINRNTAHFKFNKSRKKR